MLRTVCASLAFVSLSVLFVAGFSGCNASGTSPGDTTKDDTDASNGSTATVAKSRSKGREVGGIPLDVWLDSPLEVAANRTPVGGNSGADAKSATGAPAGAKPTTETGGSSSTPAPADKPVASGSGGGGAGDWKTILPMEELISETKTVRSRITDNLQSIGKYNGNYKEIRVDAATMAALGAIAIAHPDNVTWKPNAKHVRDLGSDITKKAKGLGNEPFKATQQSWEKLDALLSGNNPADLGDAAAEAKFNEVCNRSAIMFRMERAFQWMKSNVSSEATFKKELERVAHEAHILAALGKVVATDGYTSADEAEYQTAIKTMVQACLDIAAATKAENFTGYSDALSKTQKACDECHIGYRFAN